MPMNSMRAMVLDRPGQPLVMRERPMPQPAASEILVAVSACGVCRTDLHVVDGELQHPKLPIVPGHEIVGRVAALGSVVEDFRIGQRVGIPWLGSTDGVCPYCLAGRENLCDAPVFTGYTRDGGYATHAVADARFCFALPSGFDDAAAAPLLCAGLIGWRSYRMAGEGAALGIYGFGAAAHILAQVAVWQGRRVHSPGQATVSHSISREAWAPAGPAAPTKCRPSPLMRPSSSRPWVLSCRPPCAR
jgi:propanol-preferring alcohol dehydrogenase